MNFAPIAVTRETLQSRQIRNLVGDRIIDLAQDFVSSGSSPGGIVNKIFNFASKFVGFLVKAVISTIVWTFSDLWDVAVEAYFELKYFDWNQTDASLKAELKSNDDLLAGALGRLTGTSLVWLTGVAVSTGLSFKYPVLSGKIALELAQEGGQEIRSALTNLIIVSRQIAIKNVLLGGLLNARRLELFGFKPVTENRKPWSFNDGIENSIKSLPTSGIRAFATQAIDAVEDAVIEMGYVIAYTLDDFYLSQRMANESVLGQNRVIELTPDVRVDEERIIINSPQELAISTTQEVIASHQLIHNRDVGQIAGMPEIDYVRAKPQRRKLKVIFRSKEHPPWKLENGEIAKTVEANIPDAKYGLTWNEVKTTMKSFTWGKYYVTALLDNGRQMRCYGASHVEAKQQLQQWIKLSTASITRLFNGEVETEDPNPNRRKVPTRVYPAYVKLIKGDVRADGTLRSNNRDTDRVDLWVTEEPDNSDQLK